jgi:hypothetical protein
MFGHKSSTGMHSTRLVNFELQDIQPALPSTGQYGCMQYFYSAYVKSAKMGLFKIAPSVITNKQPIPKVLQGIEW